VEEPPRRPVYYEPEWRVAADDPSEVAGGRWSPDPAGVAEWERRIREWLREEEPPEQSSFNLGEFDIWTQKHLERVRIVINWGLVKATQVKPRATLSQRLQLARELVTNLRRGNYFAGGLDRLSESIMLRDAERYLWGRSGIDLFWSWGGYGSELVGTVLARPVQQGYEMLKMISLVPRVDPDRPHSLPGGTAWFDLGLVDALKIDAGRGAFAEAPILLTSVSVQLSIHPPQPPGISEIMGLR